jgi:membrane protein insertase Oxa1/YidC/SpoIIIJ
MGITTFFQMKAQPGAADPTQKMIFNWTPPIFIFMLAGFSAGTGRGTTRSRCCSKHSS